MVNHWWQVTLYVSSRGLTTSLMHTADRGLEIEFDFLDHVLDIRCTDGQRRRVPLTSGSVADFYSSTLTALAELGIVVKINTTPSEIADVVPFTEDRRHREYDTEWAQRFWTVLVHADRVLDRFRSAYLGKSSPVHFFWGGADLAVTRFSGRTAPLHPGGVPNCPDWVQQLAYSHEVHSVGYWPGGSPEGSFYAYAYPEPDGFSAWPVRPDAAYYDADLGEFLLPYEAVRTADDPDELLLSFCQSTYEAVAELASWDRANLEVP
jgi:hypothetical protein